MGFWKKWFPGREAQAAEFAKKFRPIPANFASDRQQLYLYRDRDVDVGELEDLCDAVGWARRPPRKVKIALQNSFLVLSVWEVRGNYKRLVGFARATSDGAFNATLWDVAIHPKFQGKGLGTYLMQETIRELRQAEISNISLFADGHVVEFYRRLGFLADPEGIKGMFWYPSP